MEQAGPPEVPDSGAPAGGVVVPLEPQHLPGQNVSHLAVHHRTDWVVSLESLNRFKCQNYVGLMSDIETEHRYQRHSKDPRRPRAGQCPGPP